MSPEIKVIHLEDCDADAELVSECLRRRDLACEIKQTKTREEFLAALERPDIDLILSDFSLPGFDGLGALEAAHEKRPGVPFIFVSGTICEETAIDALKRGASDYVFKHRLPRLAPAVHRALAEAAHRRELQRAEEAMIQSEYKYRQIFECLGEAALLAEVRTGRIVDTNRQSEILLGRSRAEILGMKIERVLLPATAAEYRDRLVSPEVPPGRVVFEGDIYSKEGRPTPVAISAAPISLYDRRFILGLYRDITDRKRMEAELQRLRDECRVA